jgi:hypothetical protein
MFGGLTGGVVGTVAGVVVGTVVWVVIGTVVWVVVVVLVDVVLEVVEVEVEVLEGVVLEVLVLEVVATVLVVERLVGELLGVAVVVRADVVPMSIVVGVAASLAPQAVPATNHDPTTPSHTHRRNVIMVRVCRVRRAVSRCVVQGVGGSRGERDADGGSVRPRVTRRCCWRAWGVWCATRRLLLAALLRPPGRWGRGRSHRHP